MARVVVLDSGLDGTCKLSYQMGFKGGIGFFENDNKVFTRYGEYDDVGHGTAVASLIKMLYKGVDIIPVKIIANGYVETTFTLIESLKYIYENVECDVINISAGIVSCSNISELNDWCEKLLQRGTIIVAAYDNLGAVSYPAELECVIGISGDRKLEKGITYKKIEGTNNYYGRIKERILPWLNNTKQTVSGASFLAPEFTAKIAALMDGGIRNFDDIIEALDKESMGSIKMMNGIDQRLTISINKAIIFPFNKEMHSLARFRDLLVFDIYGIYDTKYSGNVGKSMAELQGIEDYEIFVKDINEVDWEDDFDTVILGHTSTISKAVGKDYEKDIIDKCIKYGKQLFSCRDIRERNDINLSALKYYVPCIDKLYIKDMVKMHVIGCPVLGVVGTGGNQGKFTIQLGIRKELLGQGYKLGQIGTEPTAQLFGFDNVFPIGHESAVYTKGFESVVALNTILGDIQKKEPDLILFGSQANTVPYHVGGPQDYPIVQHELILGCQADAYILCVSNDADKEYIIRTINYLQSVYESKVIAIVISHLSLGARWSNFTSTKAYLSDDEMERIVDEVKVVSDIPIIKMSDEKLYSKIAEIIINYFSEE